MTEQTNTPKLRFPEFSEEWENKSITDDFSIIDGDRGKHYPSSKDLLKKGDCIFLSAENITKKGWSFKNLKFITRKKDISMGKGKLKLNDLILTTRGTVGNVVRYHEEIPFQDMRINSGMVILRTIQPSQFFLTLFTSNFMKRFLNKVTVQSAQPHLTVATIKTMKFFIPKSIKEQEKIGTFFSKLDRQIELEEKKLELLEQQKCGYMQKIFSQELRFKDESGNDYPEWKERKFSELLSYSSNGVDKKINKNHDIAYMVNYMDVFNKTKLNTKNRDLLMETTATKIQKEKNNLKKGDILFTPSSETREDIAKSTVVFEDLDNTVYSYHLIRLRPLDSNIFSLKYSNYLSEQNFISKQFRRLAQGAQRYTLTKEHFENIRLNLPHITEQEKIGDFFSKLDEVINKQSQKIDELKLRKQGFLQKMFI